MVEAVVVPNNVRYLSQQSHRIKLDTVLEVMILRQLTFPPDLPASLMDAEKPEHFGSSE